MPHWVWYALGFWLLRPYLRSLFALVGWLAILLIVYTIACTPH